jgi:Immunity protein 21
MDEIESLGGPLICVESRLAGQWRGIDGISIDSNASIGGIATDYDRAGSIPNQYLSVLPLRHGAALILGDRPLITGVWKNLFNRLIIWRISYANPDDDVPSLLASLDEKSFGKPVESIEFSFGSRDVVIFDTASPGDEAGLESVSFDIDPDRYLVTTHVVRPVLTAELLLHRFHAIK